MKKVASVLFIWSVMATTLLAAPTENVDFLRSIGKIYVVVAVLVAIFLGIVIFLILLERKISKLETQINEA
jgi:hypothetical protein